MSWMIYCFPGLAANRQRCRFISPFPCHSSLSHSDWHRFRKENRWRVAAGARTASISLQEQRREQLSLCRKITNFGAYPSRLWVRGTANTHNPLITAQNKSENTVQLVLCRKDSSILPLIQSSLLTWWKSTRQTVSHPRTQNQSWQQVAVYGMYLYEQWNLGALRVVFLAPRSLSEQSSRNSGPVSERAAVWKAKKSHITLHAQLETDFYLRLQRSGKIPARNLLGWAYVQFISTVRSMVGQATWASRSANQDLFKPPLSLK